MSNPAFDLGDLGWGRTHRLGFWRHRAIGQPFEQDTGQRLAGHDSRAIVTRLESRLGGSQVKPSLGVAAVVTSDARCAKQRCHVALKRNTAGGFGSDDTGGDQERGENSGNGADSTTIEGDDIAADDDQEYEERILSSYLSSLVASDGSEKTRLFEGDLKTL